MLYPSIATPFLEAPFVPILSPFKQFRYSVAVMPTWVLTCPPQSPNGAMAWTAIT